jgi:hypothetical protein
MIRSAIIACLFAAPAAAQSQCGPHPVVVAQLADKYGETRRGMGMAGQAIAELYASDAGTWTIVVTLPDGSACLIASGEGWESFNDALPPKGADL